MEVSAGKLSRPFKKKFTDNKHVSLCVCDVKSDCEEDSCSHFY